MRSDDTADQIFDLFFNSLFSGSKLVPKKPEVAERNLFCDVLKEEDGVRIVADIPTGCLTPDVRVDSGILTITVNRPIPGDVSDFESCQRPYGKWTRSFKLHDDHDPDSVEATCKEGLLVITIKRGTKTSAKNVKVHT